jgi:hypothetical protein
MEAVSSHNLSGQIQLRTNVLLPDLAGREGQHEDNEQNRKGLGSTKDTFHSHLTFHLINKNEKEGNQNNPDCNGNKHSEEYTCSNAMTGSGTGTTRKHHRKHTEDKGKRSHQDRTETHPGSMQGRFDDIHTAIDLYLGKLDDQDCILCCQTDQRH